MADNIGSTLSAEYCFVEEVQSCAVTASGILLTFKTPHPWKTFPAATGQINLQVTPVTENGITRHTVTGEIKCPLSRIKHTHSNHFFEQKRVIIRRTHAHGATTIIGDLQNPVTVLAEKITPAEPTHFAGIRYIVSAEIEHPELPLL